ncbi:MAG: GxxExxY protein [Breznakibacter sp.]
MLTQDILYKDEAYKIIGSAMNVHRELGCGFLEAIYSEALEIEFIEQNIPYKREVSLNVHYKGQLLNKAYVADYICYDKIIVELKAVNYLESLHDSQVLNYLKVTGFKLGLLINFGEKSLKYKRIVKEF